MPLNIGLADGYFLHDWIRATRDADLHDIGGWLT
jgi:hypothetical protein